MALGHQKVKRSTRSNSSFETFANWHPALLPTDVMPTCKGSKPCLEPSLLSPWLTKPQKTVAEQSQFLKTSTGGGRRNQVRLPKFYVFHTCSNFAVKLIFCKSNQVVHISAKLFIKLLSTAGLQLDTKHVQLQKIGRGNLLPLWQGCSKVLAMLYTRPVSLAFSKIKSASSTWVSQHPPPHILQKALQHPSVTAPQC